MEEMKKDLIHLTAEVRNLAAAIQYLSQRTAWSETCFKQVQESGAMQMTEAVRKVLTDHKKLMSQVNILAMRLAATQGGSGGSSEGGPYQPMGKPSMNR
ncbi:hypothetical protein BDD18_3274 [Acidovorax temperans]|uniref:Uncharacterized protein n=1 Tax=Acidovorax temperans TaxID=80878 RepID=A0A543L1X6_9BURK|nr:hypothetical protein BDD18_3274 [Acidovorax temperans]